MIDETELVAYPCPVCSGTEARTLYTIDGFGVVTCCGCSMVYVNPRISNDQLYSIYTENYFHNQRDGYEDYELAAHLRIKTFRRWYREIEPKLIGETAKALDIGCAAGYFLQVLEEHGWNAVVSCGDGL